MSIRRYLGLGVAAGLVLLVGQMRMSVSSTLDHDTSSSSSSSSRENHDRSRLEQAARAKAATDGVESAVNRIMAQLDGRDDTHGHVEGWEDSRHPKVLRVAADDALAVTARSDSLHDVGRNDAGQKEQGQIHGAAAAASRFSRNTLARPLTAPILITFEWNGGRLGNQIRSFAYAVAMAHLLNGSVIVPTPKEGRPSRPSVSAIGLEPDAANPGLFDVQRLRKGIPLAFATEAGVSETLASRKKCRFIDIYQKLKGSAAWKDYAHEPRAPALVAEVGKQRCGALDLEGSDQTLPPFSVPICAWFQRDLNQQLLYHHLLPSAWVRTAVDTLMSKVQWARPFVGMHFRNQAQGKPSSECIEWVSWHLKHSNFSTRVQRVMSNVTCTMDPSAIADAWRLHGIPHNFYSVDGKWLMASDRSECSKSFDKNGVRLFNAQICPARWVLKDRHNATWINISDIEVPKDTLHTSFTRYAEAIPEVWALAQTDFFFGTLQSSLSDLVCGWRAARGEEYVRASSMCWAYHLNNIIPGPRALSACTL